MTTYWLQGERNTEANTPVLSEANSQQLLSQQPNTPSIVREMVTSTTQQDENNINGTTFNNLTSITIEDEAAAEEEKSSKEEETTPLLTTPPSTGEGPPQEGVTAGNGSTHPV
jgi:hypothetical protein